MYKNKEAVNQTTYKRTRRRWAKHLTNNRCGYCGFRDSANTVDHIKALANKGPDTLDNVIGACSICNSAKRDLRLNEFRQVLRKKHKWLDYWSEELCIRLSARFYTFSGVFYFETPQCIHEMRYRSCMKKASAELLHKSKEYE